MGEGVGLCGWDGMDGIEADKEVIVAWTWMRLMGETDAWEQLYRPSSVTPSWAESLER